MFVIEVVVVEGAVVWIRTFGVLRTRCAQILVLINCVGMIISKVSFGSFAFFMFLVFYNLLLGI
jgi:hypothetical protein